MPYAAILFDMDGTLLETGPLWDRATRSAVAEHDIVLTEEEHFGLAGHRLLHDLLGDKGYDAKTIQSVRATRDSTLIPIIAQHACWREGALNMLHALGDTECAIITSAPKVIVDALHMSLGIRSQVSTIVTGDDVAPDYKPDAKGLLIACQRMQVDPKSCVYIGDQAVDLQAAANAGMDSILIRGTYTAKDLTHDKMVEDFGELERLLV